MKEALLRVEAGQPARSVIEAIGRTEDARFSPSGRRLAIVAFDRAAVFLFEVNIASARPPDTVEITDCLILFSPVLRKPHGIAFVDELRFLVASRDGSVALFAIPDAGKDAKKVQVDPLCFADGSLLTAVRAPGSVDCYRLDDSRHRVLVCNNFSNYISSHVLTVGAQACISGTRLLLRQDLKIPDGINVSRDRRWIAVSNHADGKVLVYRNSSALNRSSRPAAILEGTVCPHGVRFSPDGRQVIVADAASTYLHLFEIATSDWRGTLGPSRSIRVLDDETFAKGRTNPREGGVKGLDIDPSGRVLVTTCEHQPLAFYDFRRLVDTPSAVMPGELEGLCRERDEFYQRLRSRLLGKLYTMRFVPRRFLGAFMG